MGLYKKVSLLIFPPKIKSALTEVSAPKTQTPLVAKPTLRNKESLTSTETEFVFLTNSHCGREKGIVSLWRDSMITHYKVGLAGL